MADFTLARPQAGQHIELTPPADARIVLGFPADQATLERSGDNLVFTFDDGSSVVVNDFYTSYTKDTLPEFVIDGQAVSGEQFFAALGEDLMPAAGPAARAQALANGGRYRDYDNAALMDGIDRLGGLDLGLDRNEEPERDLDAWGRRDDGWTGGDAEDAPNLIPGVIDHYADVTEDDPDRNTADGWALTGSVRGDGDHTLSWSSGNHAQYGTFEQNPDGTWKYTLDNANPTVDALGPGQTMQEEFTYTYTDQDGDSATGKVIITIHGTNDAPTIDAEASDLQVRVEEAGVNGDKVAVPGADPNAPYEGVPAVSGTVVAHDVDANDSLTFSIAAGTGVVVDGEAANTSQSISTQYGKLTIDDQGRYTYTLNNGKDGVDRLSQGQLVTETFTVTVADRFGGTAEQTITVTIEGTNDRPTLRIDTPEHTLAEDAAQNVVTGTFTVTDVDGDGAFGGSTDGVANQRYSIAGGTAGNGETTSGSAVDSPDTGGSASFTTAYGTLTVNPDGTYTYALNNASDAVQALGEGASHTETFEVTVTDVHGSNHTQTITVTVTGTNDAPTIVTGGDDVALGLKESGVKDGSLMTPEDGVMSKGGSFTVHDKDANDSQTVTVTDNNGNAYNLVAGPGGVLTVTTEYGVLTITPSTEDDGHGGKTTTYDYSFNLFDKNNSGYQDAAGKLNEGESVNFPFNINVTDNSGESVTQKVDVTIEGTNDAPVLTLDGGATPSPIEVSEDDVFSGTLTVEDDDRDGALGRNETTGKDETVNHKFSITHTPGENDTADGDAAYNGDFGQNASFVTKYGTLTVKPDGAYTFEPSEEAQKLGAGEDVTLNFGITVTDRHDAWDTKGITVTVKGANDAPTIEQGDGVLSLRESGLSHDAGANFHNKADGGVDHAESSFTVKDVDANDTQKVTLLLDGKPVDPSRLEVDPKTGVMTYHTEYGDLIVTPSGHDPDNITIDEAGNPVLKPADPEAGITYKYEYQLDNDKADGLTENDKPIFDFEIKVSDSAGESQSQGVKVEIQGANDIPLMGWSSVNLKEDGVQDGGNTATVDKDGSGYIFPKEHVLTAEGQIPAFQYKGEDGEYHRLPGYDPDAKPGELVFKVEGLRDGKDSWNFGKTSFECKLTDADGNTGSITVNILNTAAFGDIGTDGIQTIITDYGVLQLDTRDGSYTFTLGVPEGLDVDALAGPGTADRINAKVDGLNQGDKLELGFQATVTDKDGSGLTGTHGIGVIIQGTNDQPLLDLKGEDGDAGDFQIGADGSATASITESIDKSGAPDANTVTGKYTGTDPDTDPTLSYGVVFGEGGRDEAFKAGEDADGKPLAGMGDGIGSVEGKYGSLTLNSDGTYTYTLDDRAKELGVDADGNPIQATETFTIVVRDEHGAWSKQTVTVTVNGSNDAPVIDTPTEVEHWVKESGDIDTAKSHGTTTDTAATPDTSDDSRELTGADTGLSRKEISGKIDFHDDDLSDQRTLEILIQTQQDSETKILEKVLHEDGSITLKTQYGEITVDQQGNYTYVLDPDKSQALAQGEEKTEAFTVTVSDGKGGFSDVNITVNIVGTNDRPTLQLKDESGNTGDFTLNGAGAASGAITEAGLDKNGTAVGDADGMISGRYHGHDDDTGDNFTFGVSTTAGNRDTAFDAKDGQAGLGDGHVTAEGKYGSLTLNDDGTYTYTLNERAEHLGLDKDGNPETGTENFTIYVRDQHGAWSEQQVSITVSGSNDKPVIEKTSNTLRVDETGFDANTTGDPKHPQYTSKLVSGSVGAEDVDDSDELTYFFTDKDGKEITVGQGQVIGKLWFGKLNDKGEWVTDTEAESQPVYVTGVSDNGMTISTNYGKFQLNPETGKYTFTPAGDDGDNPLNQLNVGDKVELNFSIGVKDNHGATADKTHGVTVTIDGHNDLPSVGNGSIILKEEGVYRDTNTGGNTATTEGSVGNDGHKLISGRLELKGLADHDDGPSPTFGTGDGQFHLKLTATGSDKNHYTTPVENTENGDWTSDIRLSTGGDRQQVWNTIRRADFPPEVLDKLLTALGKDSLDKLKIGDLNDISLGTLTLHADGSYDFTLPAAGSIGDIILNMMNGAGDVQGNGYPVNRTFTFTVTDPHGGTTTSTIRVELKGTNDRPTLELASDEGGHISIETTEAATGTKITTATLTMKEDDGSVTGKVNGYDVDFDHKLVYGVAAGKIGHADSKDVADLQQAFDGDNGMDKAHTSARGEYGALTLNGDGTYTYTPNENLVHGHEYEETFTVFVRDEHGAWMQQHINVKVTGSADAPVIKGDLPSAMVAEVTEAGVRFNTNEDKDASASGRNTGEIRDPDTGEITGFTLGSFEVTQTDTQSGGSGKVGELKAGFIKDGVFHEGDLETPYGTLHIEINDGVATYSFILPKEGTPEAEALNKLTPEDRVKLFDGLKVGVYDSAHAELVGADNSTTDKDGNSSFTIDPDHAELIPGQAVDIYVHGTNDRPYFETDAEGNLAVGNVQHVSEDGGTVAGQLTAHDYDNDDSSLRFSIVKTDADGNEHLVQVIQGTYGILTLDQITGRYTYTLTADTAEFQHLNPDQLLALENFTVRVTDPLHAYTDTRLTIQMKGEEDGARLSATNLGVREDAGKENIVADDVPESGEGTLRLDVTDDQNGADQSHEFTSWSVTNPDGTTQTITTDGGEQTVNGDFGNLVLHYDGGAWKYHYELTGNKTDAIQNMALGETRTETFTVQVKNKSGETVKEKITVTINGANDAPVIESLTNDGKGAVKANVFEGKGADTSDTEHPGVVFTGTVKGHDTDNALDAGGNAITDQTEAVTYAFRVSDGNGGFILTTVVKKEFGSFTIDPNTGEYKYTLDNENVDVYGLKGKVETVDVVAVDIHGAQSDPREISITLENADAPGEGGGRDDLVFDKGDLQGAVKEDAGLTPSSDPKNPTQIFQGHLDAKYGSTDVDAGDRDYVFGLKDDKATDKDHQVQTQVKGEYGYLTIDPATGDYTYTLFNGQDGQDGPVQSLGEGQSVKETFTLMLNGKVVFDVNGNPVTIDITIQGTNDAPVIDGFTSTDGLNNTIQESVSDNQGAWSGSVSGTVEAHDIDQEYKTGTAEDGTPIYAKEKLTYSVEGGTPGEDGMVRLVRPEGTLVLNPETGEYTFTVDENHGHLTVDRSENVTFKIVVTDGSGASDGKDLTITLKGTNLGPEAQVGDGQKAVLSVTEDGTTSVTSSLGGGGLVFTDDQGPGNLSYSLSDEANAPRVSLVTGEYGSLRFNADGTYTYTLDNQSKAVQGLREGETRTETFTVTVWDQHGAKQTVEIKVDVQGANDVPVATVDQVIVAKEGGTGGSAQITAHDSDRMDDGTEEPLKFHFDQEAVNEHNAAAAPDRQWTLNADGSLTTEYGTYRVDGTGKVTFELDNTSDKVIGLAAGELAEQKITVSISDGHENGAITQEVTVNIEGSNTAPTVTEIVTNSGNPLLEDGKETTFSGSVTAVDPDSDGKVDNYMFLVDGKLVSSVDGQFGSITINSDGTYTYTLDKGLSQGLTAGVTAQDRFQVVAVDSHGAQGEPADLNISITGANDAPKFTADSVFSNSVTESGELVDGGYGSVEGTVSFTDADKALVNGALTDRFGDAHTVTVQSAEDQSASDTITQGKYGTLSITTDDRGNISYTYNLTNKELGQGDTDTDTFTLTVNDGQGGVISKNITINITGANDAPEITASATTDKSSGSFSFMDLDANDDHNLFVKVDGKEWPVGTDGKCDVLGLGEFTLTYDPEARSWNYTFTASPLATAAALLGVVVTRDFQIVVDDGLARAATPDSGLGSLSVSYTGTNPDVSADMSLTDLAPDASLNGQLPGAEGDALHYTFPGTEMKGEFGTLHFNADSGEYTYTLDTSEDGLHKLAQAQAQADGADLKESFDYTVSHQGSAGVAGALEINLNGLHTAMGGENADTLGDQNAAYSQVLFGLGGDDVLNGGSGNDFLFGGEGDDQLFGGEGDDYLYGGAGNDYLDGGSGQNHLYGGEGNDILVYSSGNAVMDGGAGIDFLVGADRNTLDTLFNGPDANPIQNVEVFVTQHNGSLTSMSDFEALGITIDADGKLVLSDGWKQTGDAADPGTPQDGQPGDGSGTGDGKDGHSQPGDGSAGAGHADGIGHASGLSDYVEYTHYGNDGTETTILVQKALLENHNS